MTMRLTALLPPPPTPITLMRAPALVSSANASLSGTLPVLAVAPPFLSCVSGIDASHVVPGVLEELLEESAQASGHTTERAGADEPGGFTHVVALRVLDEADRCGERGGVDMVGKSPALEG